MTSPDTSPVRGTGTDDPTAGNAERPWLVFAAVTLPLFLLMIDFYGIVVALPAIGDDLGGSTGELGWVVNAFAVGSSAPVLALGRLADLKGRKKVVAIGVVGFAACSLGAALAPNLPLLIVARGLAGVSGSMFFAASLAIVSNAFAADRRSTAIGLWGGVGGIGSAIGPLLAGVIIDQASWRWFFAMNVPFLLVSAVLVLRYVTESRDETVAAVDWRGFALVTAALVLVVVGLQQAVSVGLTAPFVLAATGAGLVLLVVFALVEQRTTDPLVELALFKRRAYAAPASLAFLANWAFGVVMFFLTLYLQEIVGDDAGTTGAVFVTYSLPFALVGAVSGLAARRLGARPVLAGAMGLLAAGTATFVGIDSADAMTLVIVGLVITGIGQGLVFNQSTAAAMASIEPAKAGVASGMVNTVRMVGYSVGVALTSVLVTRVADDQITAAAADRGLTLTADQLATARDSLSGSQASRTALGDLGPTVRTAADDVVQEAFLTGFRAGMILTVGVCVVGVAVALAVPGRRRSAADEHEHDDEHGQAGDDGPPGDAGASGRGQG